MPAQGSGTPNKRKNMKILIINASPRPKGAVWAMLEAVRAEAEARGHEVWYERVDDLQVRPCTGCMSCRTAGQCALPADDAQRVLDLMRAADVLVVGAPCYWAGMPGTLKVMFDRMVYGLMGEGRLGLPRPLLKGRRAILLTTCTTPWPLNVLCGQSRGTVRALRSILRTGGYRIVCAIERGGTRRRPLTEGDLERCRRAVRRL